MSGKCGQIQIHFFSFFFAQAFLNKFKKKSV